MTEMWQRIRQAREAAGLRQEDLAEMAGGIDRAAVSAWESPDPRRRTTPRAARLQAIADATHVSVDWLVSGIGTGPNHVREDPAPWRPAPATETTPREAALLGYFRGLTAAQQEAFLRDLRAAKQHNDDLIAELAALRRAS